MKKSQIKHIGVSYELPEGFSLAKIRDRLEIVDADNKVYEVCGGATRDSNVWIQRVSPNSGPNLPSSELNQKRLVRASSEPHINRGSAWFMNTQIINTIQKKKVTTETKDELLKIIEEEFEQNGDADLKAYSMPRIAAVVQKYLDTGIWDYVLLGQEDRAHG
jgi:hypothetical protein